MDKSLQLGKAYTAAPMARGTGRISNEERLAILEQLVSEMLKLIMILRAKTKRSVEEPMQEVPEEIQAPHGLNKDGIPNELVCIGETEKQQFPLCMTVKQDSYVIGMTSYPSLSAAAEAVSGVRRSGWAFWKLPDGRTLKEVYFSFAGEISGK